MTVNQLFDEARRRIAVSDEVLAEARRRRDLIRDIVEEEFHTLRTFGSGSIAHGTQNTPLTDVDTGAVLDRRSYPELGPAGDGPVSIAEQIRTRLRDRLRDEYPDAHFYLGGKRAIKISFNDPVEVGAEDFTADLIVAIARSDGGLWIPNLKQNLWEASDPECHTQLVVARNKATGSMFARAIRLAKHANGCHNRPICSFNVTALGLEVLTEQVPLPTGLAQLFRHAADSLRLGPTQDPAGVSGPIGIGSDLWTAAATYRKLAELAEEALRLAEDGQLAQAQRNWSKVLPGAVDPPGDRLLRAEIATGLRVGNERVRQGAGGMAVAGGIGRAVPSGRAFGDSGT